MTEYRKKQVIEALRGICEISEPQLAYYLKLGIVTPDVANPSGRAEIKYYGPANFVDIVIARELEKCGLSLKAIQKVMGSIRKEVRAKYKSLKDHYRFDLKIGNPNTPECWAELEMILLQDLQRTKKTVDHRKPTLDMDTANAYLVVDLSKIIQKMESFLA